MYVNLSKWSSKNTYIAYREIEKRHLLEHLCDLSSCDLRNLIQSKDVSPFEAVESCINRIQEFDRRLNAFVTKSFARTSYELVACN